MAYSKADFSTAQAAVILHLGDACAIDRDSAVTVNSAGAASILVDGYFCMKRTVKPKGGSQRTVYWLTERGLRAFAGIRGKA